MKTPTYAFALLILICAAIFESNGQTAVLEWANSFTGDRDNEPLAILVDDHNNFIVTGHFENSIDLDPGTGSTGFTSNHRGDCFIAKYTSSGSLIWAHAIGDILEENGFALAFDLAGNILLAGSFSDTVDFDPGPGNTSLVSSSPYRDDAFVAKYTPAGSLIWVFKLDGTGVGTFPVSINTDNLGNILLSGKFYGTVDLDTGPGTDIHTSVGYDDVFFAKYSPTGVYMWGHGFGTNATGEESNSIVSGSNGDVYITGRFNGTVDVEAGAGVHNLVSAGGSDIFLLKYSAAGTLVWAHQIGGTGYDWRPQLEIDNNDDLLVCGGFGATVDFDFSSGQHIITAGSTYDIFVCKYDAGSNLVWAKTATPGGSWLLSDMKIDKNNHILISGAFKTSIDLGSSSCPDVHTNSGTNYSPFLWECNPAGTPVWSTSISSTDVWNQFNLCAYDTSGAIIVAGTFEDTLDADPGIGVHPLIWGDGDDDMFMAKYSIQPDTTPCVAPTGLYANDISPHDATLNWLQAGHHYEVRGRVLGGNWIYHSITGSNTTQLNIATLNNYSFYEWQVKTYCDPCDVVGSPWSVLDTFYAQCNPPMNTWTDPILGHAARLNWSPAGEAVDYEIRGRRVGVQTWTSFTVGSNQTSLDVFNLSGGNTYQWTVRALCDTQGNNKSAWTPLTNFSTPLANRLGTEVSNQQFEQEQKMVSIAPNPSNDKATIRLIGFSTGDYQFNVFSIAGEQVLFGTLNASQEGAIDVSHFKPGIYILSLETEHGSWHERLVVQ